MNDLYNPLAISCDAPKPWGVYFQDSASPQMEALIELHDNIMFYLVIILFGVAWVMLSIIRNYVNTKSPISNKYLNHGTLIELIWTITPAFILILIAFPSFKLLYLMDEVTDPSLTIFVEGHQWYWSYQYPDFLSDDGEELEFDSCLVPESDLGDGVLRMLEVNFYLELDLSLDQLFSDDNTGTEDIPGIESVPDLDFTDNDSVIGDCEHDKLFAFRADSQVEVDQFNCDLCHNPAFGEVGDYTRVCDKCNIVLCDKCYVEDTSSESESEK